MSGLIEACKHPNNNIVCIHIYIYIHPLLYMKPALQFLKPRILFLKKSASKSLYVGSQIALVLCVLYFDSEE